MNKLPAIRTETTREGRGALKTEIGSIRQTPLANEVVAVSNDGSGISFLWLYAALAGSLLLRLSVLDFESGDYKAFLSHWYDYLVEHGRVAAFKDDFGRYPLPYLYLVSLSTLLPLPKLYAIKLFSILADYVAAWLVFKIVRRRFRRGPEAWLAALGFLFLPTVWFNSAVWGQCDAMYTAALLGSLYCLLVNRPISAVACFGLGCALKPQGVFLAPLLAGWVLQDRSRWKLVAIPPLVYAACGVPAILAGRPFLEVILHWTEYRNRPLLTMGATNWFQWIPNNHFETFELAGIVLAVISATFVVLAMQRRVSLERDSGLVSLALLSVMLCPYFLPGMHERYFYPADAVSLIYALFVSRGWVVAMLVQFCSFFTYLPYLFNSEPVPRPLLSLLMTGALGLVAVGFARAFLGPLGPARDCGGDK
jgi:Gpi18-like mannosyltransferase